MLMLEVPAAQLVPSPLKYPCIIITPYILTWICLFHNLPMIRRCILIPVVKTDLSFGRDRWKLKITCFSKIRLQIQSISMKYALLWQQKSGNTIALVATSRTVMMWQRLQIITVSLTIYTCDNDYPGISLRFIFKGNWKSLNCTNSENAAWEYVFITSLFVKQQSWVFIFAWQKKKLYFG